MLIVEITRNKLKVKKKKCNKENMEVLSVFYNRKRSTIYDPSRYGQCESGLKELGMAYYSSNAFWNQLNSQ